MAKSQQEYSAEFEKQGLDKLNTSAAERRQQDEKTIQQLNSTIDRQAALATKPYEEQIDELGVQARDAYDLSAIQEQVDRRQAEEAMASLGLTGSGLAHTQQQAAGVRRSKTDAGVRREVDRQSTALRSQIDQLLENASIDKQEKADAIRTATDEWENASRDSIREQSVTVGAQLYDSEAQREFDREENQKRLEAVQALADQEERIARLNAETEQQKLFSQLQALYDSGVAAGKESAPAVQTRTTTSREGVKNTAVKTTGSQTAVKNAGPPSITDQPIRFPEMSLNQYAQRLSDEMEAGLINDYKAINDIVRRYPNSPLQQRMAAEMAGISDAYRTYQDS